MNNKYEQNLTHAPTVAKAVEAGFVPVMPYADLPRRMVNGETGCMEPSWSRDEADKGRPFYGFDKEKTLAELAKIKQVIAASETRKKMEAEQRIAESLSSVVMAQVYDSEAARQAA